jgi:heptosyltransferase-2
LVPGFSGTPENPRLQPPPLSAFQPAPRPLVGLIPGAARGPSKRWPAEHFAEIGKRLAEDRGASLLIFGAPSEFELCGSVAKRVGTRAQNYAGKTSLPEWAALLKSCDLVVCNDSGGMHLASALGTPVVAVYGMTDPAKTGPLGANARVIQDEGARARDIAQDSAEAEKRLAALAPARVYDAAANALAAVR